MSEGYAMKLRGIFIVWTLLLCCALSLSGCGGGGGSSQGQDSGGVSPNLMGGAGQGNPLSLTARVSTLAGLPLGISPIDAPWTSPNYNYTSGFVTLGTNLYVADPISRRILKLDLSTGIVSSLAGYGWELGSVDGIGTAARFATPTGITTDGTNLYVTDTLSHTIRKVVIATGEVTTFAGSQTYGFPVVDGIGTSATFFQPKGITSDGTNLFVTDYEAIRKIVISTGEVTTLAGSPIGVGGVTDGVGTAARFAEPAGITTDGTNLYVVDSQASTVRKVEIATGTVTTLAGKAYASGSLDGIGAAARFAQPYDITTDGTHLYVCDTSNDKIRKVEIATGAVTTLAGSGANASVDGIGTAAQFSYPRGIATDGVNLYVSDAGNILVRKVAIATGAVTTLAVSSGGYGANDGTGTAARFITPNDLTTDGTNLFVSDSGNDTIRKVVIATGAVTTLAGNAYVPSGSADGTGYSALFNNPQGITTDGTNLYVCDADNNTIRKVVIATGVVTTFAGSPGASGSTDGIGATARFDGPFDITNDGSNLYVSETHNHTIRKIAIATGAVTTLAGKAGVPGATNGIGSAALFHKPQGITTDGSNLFITDTNNYVIRKVVIATGEVTTFAGSNGSAVSNDGTGEAATFYRPVDVTSDGTSLYLSDNNTIRKVVIATKEVTTIAGSAGLSGSTDAVGSAARFNRVNGIATDGKKLYVTDCYSNTIRSIE